jgi:2-polyprenyl-6-methoxyphenol hydroxylase-like FAD-dependent oxidoreductase
MIDGLNRLFSNSSATLVWARRLGLSAVDSSAMAKRFFIDRAMGAAAGAPRTIKALPR